MDNLSYTPPANKSDKPAVTNGFSYTIPNGITIATLNSAGLLGTGTITMPSNPTDGMAINVQSNKGVTILSIQANSGQSFAASPITVMAANMPYKVKYSAIDSTWYPN